MLQASRSERSGRSVLIILIVVVFPMMLAAAVVAAAVYGVIRLWDMRWYWWMILSPVLYIGWLTLYLLLCARHTKRLGRFPKPRRGINPMDRSAEKLDRSAITVMLCMFRASFNPTLPLVPGLMQFPEFRKLVLRSYAPSLHIAHNASVWGTIMDPDLTEIGEETVIGWNTEVSAHVLTGRVYLSAPIKIGAGVTIGGSSRVGLGCVIGDGAVIEPMSFLRPFTIVAPGETWGGNPAVLLRKRGEAQAEISAVPEPIPAVPLAAPSAPLPAAAADIEKARRLIASALGINASEVTRELSAETCSAWDSMGQVSIATALFDGYGVSVGGDQIFRLRTLEDVANAIAGQAPAQKPKSQTVPVAASKFALAVGADLDPARKLVISALGLNPADAPPDLSADSCPAWDSVGQVAIATALFDSYGITVGNRMYELRTLADVASVISRSSSAAPQTLPIPEPAALMPVDDVEMLPLLEPAAATRAIAARFSEPLAVAPLRVVIAASSTAQALAPTMKLWGRAFGFELDIEFAGFNQIAQTLLSPGSAFAANTAGINIVLADPSDRAFESPEQAAAGIEELLGTIESWLRNQPKGAQILVGTLPPQVSAFASLDRSQYEPLRHQWRARLESLPGVQLFDFAAVVEEVGILAARSSGNEAISRMPYSPALYQSLGIALVRRILASRRTPAKVIAVDCDNTLWGGVLGELGLEGIKLGADGAGRSFQLFQQRLKRLKERGLLLVVVSKNEEADVLRVFENHPDMALRSDDISGWRVNWKHKSENLQELAEELNLGADSFVFLDDDPAVRMEVSMRLPGVHVAPLPGDPARYCEILERLWLFDGSQATETDLKRTRMMQEESRRRRERTRSGSLEEYLAGLELEVEMREPKENEWARVAQLTQRTNQFNLSLQRRTLEEVKAFGLTSPVLIIHARDKFGDYGLVGICFLDRAASGATRIDTLLMSCRVLGRGVEDAFLHSITRVAAGDGALKLVAPYVQGPRNQMVKEFLIRSGFSEVEPNRWELPITTLPALPSHIRWLGEERFSTVSAPN